MLYCAIGFLILGLSLGYLAGLLAKDKDTYDMLRSQQTRGDYWFDRYQQAIDSDWEPTEDIS